MLDLFKVYLVLKNYSHNLFAFIKYKTWREETTRNT